MSCDAFTPLNSLSCFVARYKQWGCRKSHSNPLFFIRVQFLTLKHFFVHIFCSSYHTVYWKTCPFTNQRILWNIYVEINTMKLLYNTWWLKVLRWINWGSVLDEVSWCVVCIAAGLESSIKNINMTEFRCTMNKRQTHVSKPLKASNIFLLLPLLLS